MKRQFLLALVSAATCLPVLAQEDWDVWETDWEKDGALILASTMNIGRYSERCYMSFGLCYRDRSLMTTERDIKRMIITIVVV